MSVFEIIERVEWYLYNIDECVAMNYEALWRRGSVLGS